jgi:hypothetical protein
VNPHQNGLHLTEDQFADVLMGLEPAADLAAHLETCAACRAEIDLFTGSVADFSHATLSWSEAQPELQRPVVSGSKATPPHRLFPAVSWALAATLFLGFMIPVTIHFEHERQDLAANTAPGSSVSIEGDSPEQIASDNALMAAVNEELSQSQAALLARHGWRPATMQPNLKSHPHERRQ